MSWPRGDGQADGHVSDKALLGLLGAQAGEGRGNRVAIKPNA